MARLRGRAPSEGSKPRSTRNSTAAGLDVKDDLLRAETVADLLEQDEDDGLHVLARERMEDDDVVDPVEELRVEGALQLVLDRALDGGELLLAALGLLEAEVLAAGDDLPRRPGSRS